MKSADTNSPARPSLRGALSPRGLLALALVLSAAALLVALFPERQERILENASRFFWEMAAILPAIAVLIGLFSVFVSQEVITAYLGRSSGIVGFGLSLALGALPAGPLYIAFPIAAAMIRKGARIANVVVFLTAWASVKLPQEIVEIQFMGIDFATLRFVLTVLAAALIGRIIERVVDREPRRQASLQSAGPGARAGR